MNQRHQEQLRSVAEYCLRQDAGFLTPTGKPQKPPTYWIVKCSDCGLSLTSSKRVSYKAMGEGKAKCPTWIANDERPTLKNWTKQIPSTRVCGKPVDMIEEITA